MSNASKAAWADSAVGGVEDADGTGGGVTPVGAVCFRGSVLEVELA